MWRFILKNWQYVLIGALVLALYIASKNAIANKQKYQREKKKKKTKHTDMTNTPPPPQRGGGRCCYDWRVAINCRGV